MTGVAAATRVAAPPSRLEEQSKDPSFESVLSRGRFNRPGD